QAGKAIPLLGMEDDGPNRRSARYNRDELTPSHRLLQKGPTALFSTLATKGIEHDSGRLLSHSLIRRTPGGNPIISLVGWALTLKGGVPNLFGRSRLGAADY